MSRPLSLRILLNTWVALLVLLALTLGSAYLNLGAGNTLVNLVIAAVKVALIATIFMHLRRAGGAVRIAAGAALFFLLILALLSFSDLLTRPLTPAPWQAPESLD
jgi:cytochrome c oxidase subunit 4